MSDSVNDDIYINLFDLNTFYEKLNKLPMSKASEYILKDCIEIMKINGIRFGFITSNKLPSLGYDSNNAVIVINTLDFEIDGELFCCLPHEIGHHFSWIKNNDSTEESANKWFLEYLEHIPIYFRLEKMELYNQLMGH